MAAEKSTSMEPYPLWLGEDNLMYCDVTKLEQCLEQKLNFSQIASKNVAKDIDEFLTLQRTNEAPLHITSHKFPHLLTPVILKSMHAEHIQRLYTNFDEYGSTALSSFVRSNNQENVKLLKESISTDQWFKFLQIPDRSGKTPLDWAAYRGNTEMMIELLASMSDDQRYELLKLKTGSKVDRMPLHYAVHERRIGMVRQLLGYFTTAAQQSQLRLLLQDRDSSGRTLLMWAVQKNHTDTVKVMISAICAGYLQDRLLLMTDEAGQTIAHCAAYEGHTKILELIHDSLEPRVWDKLIRKHDSSGATPLYLAVVNGQTQVVEQIKHWMKPDIWIEFLIMKADTGTSCVSWAAYGNYTIILESIKQSLSQDQWYQALQERIQYSGWTALHSAVWQGHSNVVKLIHESLSEDQWCHLLQLGDRSGRTALHFAAWTDNTEIMWFIHDNLSWKNWENLIQQKDIYGFTVLQTAVYRYKENEQMVLSLRDSLKDPDIWTALLNEKVPAAEIRSVDDTKYDIEGYKVAIESLKNIKETVAGIMKELILKTDCHCKLAHCYKLNYIILKYGKPCAE